MEGMQSLFSFWWVLVVVIFVAGYKLPTRMHEEPALRERREPDDRVTRTDHKKRGCPGRCPVVGLKSNEEW